MYQIELEFNAGDQRMKRGTKLDDKVAEAYPNFKALHDTGYIRHLPENEPAAPKKSTKKVSLND